MFLILKRILWWR